MLVEEATIKEKNRIDEAIKEYSGIACISDMKSAKMPAAINLSRSLTVPSALLTNSFTHIDKESIIFASCHWYSSSFVVQVSSTAVRLRGG